MGSASEGELSLTDEQRDRCIVALDEDGFCLLPVLLPTHMIKRANAYMDTYQEDHTRVNAPATPGTPEHPLLSGGGLLTEMSIVEADPVFREIMMFKPALQLCYDVRRPTVQLVPMIFNAYHFDRPETRPVDTCSVSPV